MTGQDASGGPEATVLVVDDDRRTADLYATELSEYYAVRTAYSGEEALAAFDEYVDVVLLDRRMPDVSGDDVLDRLREREVDCRIVMVTAVDPDFDIVDMPFDDYLSKPVDAEDLLETVERQLLVASYDTRVNEYRKLCRKIELLEAEKDSDELANSGRYEELTVLADSLREDLEEMLDEHEALAETADRLPEAVDADAATE